MATELKTSASALIGQTLAGKYLTFSVGEESYAIPGLKVREIIGQIINVDCQLRCKPDQSLAIQPPELGPVPALGVNYSQREIQT